MSSSDCAVCGGGGLTPHLHVAGEAGEQGLTPTTDRFGTALSDIVRCTACGHMQLAVMPPAEELKGALTEAASEDYLHEEPGQRLTARAALTLIETQVTPGALLDLGCWVGFLLDEARRRGWETIGVEPSEFASAYARDVLGLNVTTAELFAVELPPRSFDAVILGDVIEHLPAPGSALERIADLVRPRGVLYLALPDAGSPVARALGRRWWSVIPTHVQYFTRRSIAILLERHGWEVLRIATAPKAFTVGYYLSRIKGYSPAAGRGLLRGAERMGVAERLWAPDFRDRMMVLARAQP